MVTVDMSKTRLQISKRKRRIRRLQRRRIQKAQREHQAQFLAAGKAKESRQRAVQKWLEDEKRLAKRRETSSRSPSTPKRKPRVRFAENVSVAEIPTKPQHKLPKPTSSPIGVRLARDDDDNESPNRHLVRNATTLRFALFSSEDNYDESNDPDFIPGTEEEGEELNPLPMTTPKRRIIAVPVPLENSASSGRQKILQASASNTSPRLTDRSQSHASPKAGKPKTIRAKSPIKTEFPEQCEPCTVDASPNGPSKRSRRKRKHHALHSGQSINTSNSSPPSPNSDNDKRVTLPNVNDAVPNTPDSPRTRKKKRRKLLNGQHSAQAGPTKLISPKKNDKDPDQKIASISKSLSGDEAKRNVKQNSPSGLGERSEGNGVDHSTDREDSEIDTMFGELVRQKAQKKLEKGRRVNLREDSIKSPKKQASKTEINRPQQKKGPTRYTEEGFRIMTYDEIKADQPLGLNGECPFDCSCCY
ncbi:hypothetical protein BWQ96_06356 [Gracilariopsis chorda]|uniref:DUF1764 domain-containing protein n=1 Tax=Gracilariopsis chorda TaxID=448386 RepID=A0A2V3IRZ0_9FLOR|nr:hypothetical protein BWQ96_06356 [Gracilariopsis chorda]|eukprot:PXF43890.1 hypothetical protein BWQ96_06356 [Gracilariopsis chorda]